MSLSRVRTPSPALTDSDRIRVSSVKFEIFFAGVAQLAEHDVANVVVEGSNPFARSYGGFSGFGHGFRWKQLVPEHLALPPLLA